MAPCCLPPFSGAARPRVRCISSASRSEEHTSELQSHSDLYSFPTRRSSDLRSGGIQRHVSRLGFAAVSWRAAYRRIPPRRRTVFFPVRPRPELAGWLRAVSRLSAAQRGHEFVVFRPHQDRKSTRLNSSHTVICTLSLHDALPIYDPEEFSAMFPDLVLPQFHGAQLIAGSLPGGERYFFPSVQGLNLPDGSVLSPAFQRRSAATSSLYFVRIKIGRAHV